MINWSARYIRLNHVAELLNVNISTIHKLKERGILDIFHAGGTNAPRVINNQKLHALILEKKLRDEAERKQAEELLAFSKQYMRCVERTNRMVTELMGVYSSSSSNSDSPSSNSSPKSSS